MVHKWKFTVFYLCNLVMIISTYLEDPNDSPDYLYSRVDQNKDIRQNFLNKRRLDRLTEKRVKILDRIVDDNVFVDGIIHNKINKKHIHLKHVNKIEKAFRNLIAMKGVKYMYRRDPYWRTWRLVEYPDGNERVICYRCQNSANCTSCQYSGYWIIEENPPPCPFEVVSVINNEELCAANITNSTNVEKQCPSIIQFSDVLGVCDNPIETKWRILKDYKKGVSVRYPAILCNGRDFCELSTLYLITRDYVSFRIINSTNHITYSRVMKYGKKNYACVFDCGKIDPITKTVSKTDKPLVVDLINNKNKRDDKTQQPTASFDLPNSSGPVYYRFKNHKFIQSLENMETVFNFKDSRDVKKTVNHHHHKKHPSCSSLKHMENDTSDDD